MNDFRLFPEQASNIAVGTDHLFYGLLALSGVILLLVLALVVTFASATGAAPRRTRGKLPEFDRAAIFEIGWTAGTLFLALSSSGGRRDASSRALVAAEQRAGDPCRRQAMDVEDAASRTARARSTRCTCRSASRCGS